MAGGYPCCCQSSTSESPTSFSTDSSTSSPGQTCGGCNSETGPPMVKVTIAGLVGNQVPGLSNYNGTFYLPYTSGGSLQCLYRIPIRNFGANSCGYSTSGQFLNFQIDNLADPPVASIRYSVIIVSDISLDVVSWRITKSYGAVRPNCCLELKGLDIGLFNNTACDGGPAAQPGATCHVNAINCD